MDKSPGSRAFLQTAIDKLHERAAAIHEDAERQVAEHPISESALESEEIE